MLSSVSKHSWVFSAESTYGWRKNIFIRHVLVLYFLGRARLLQWLRFVEGFKLHALVEHPHHGRHGRGVAVEKARPEYLGRKADIG